ncbi:MAG: hypothetical protein WBM11_10240 [Terriglobales bacterium]
MTQHTLGPWKATRVQPFSYQITTDQPHGSAHYGIIVREVRAEGNAHLIAAAPELLSSLEKLLPALDLVIDSFQLDIPEQFKTLAEDVARSEGPGGLRPGAQDPCVESGRAPA